MPHDRNQDLSELHAWIAAISPELQISTDEIPVNEVLDLSKSIAYGVTRPGVPVTAFLAGLATGRGQDAHTVLSLLNSRAQQWQEAAAE